MKNIKEKTKKLYFVSLLGILLYIFVDLGKAALMGVIYDSFDDIQALVRMTFFVFLVIVCVFISGYGKNMLYQKMRYVFRTSLSQALLNAYFQKNPEVFHQQEDSSKVINTITNKVEEVSEHHCINKLTSFYYLASVLLSSCYIAVINVYSLLFIYIFVLVLLSINHIYKARLKENQQQVMLEKEKWIRTNRDLFQNYDLIKNYQMETAMLTLADKTNIAMNHTMYKNELFKGTLIALNDSISNILFLGFLLFSGFMVNKGIISAGQMIMMIQASNLITMPLTNYANLRNNRFAVEPMMAELEAILADQEEREDSTPMEVLSDIQQICFDKVTFRYGETTILHQVDVSLKTRRHYLLCGESGSGKSTLLKLLIKNLNHYEGNIFVNDKKLADIPFAAWMKKLSYVEQKATLLPITLKENIVLHAPYEETKLAAVLAMVHLQSFLPKLDQYISQEHMELSGGELQRLNLARALYQDHDILVLDEAFSALDKNNEYQILKNVLEVKDSVLCISHRLDDAILRLFDEIVFVKEHQVIQGSYQEMMQCEDFVSFVQRNEQKV